MVTGTAMPVLETERLLVRTFTLDDLDACHQLLDLEAWRTGSSLEQRATWLRWTVLGYEALAGLRQPPYGDRAVVLKRSSEVVGSVGFVPSMSYFGRLPSFGGDAACELMQPEVGLFWATRNAHLRQGYAGEAARALVEYAFTSWRLTRLVATTEYDNAASQAVMRHLGMTLERNPRPDPPWFQVVGVLFNDPAKAPS
jgi:RimJ/RimL family protein N-acetyltransferase